MPGEIAARHIEIPREHRGKEPIAPLPSISTNFFDKRKKNASNNIARDNPASSFGQTQSADSRAIDLGAFFKKAESNEQTPSPVAHGESCNLKGTRFSKSTLGQGQVRSINRWDPMFRRTFHLLTPTGRRHTFMETFDEVVVDLFEFGGANEA